MQNFQSPYGGAVLGGVRHVSSWPVMAPPALLPSGKKNGAATRYQNSLASDAAVLAQMRQEAAAKPNDVSLQRGLALGEQLHRNGVTLPKDQSTKSRLKREGGTAARNAFIRQVSQTYGITFGDASKNLTVKAEWQRIKGSPAEYRAFFDKGVNDNVRVLQPGSNPKKYKAPPFGLPVAPGLVPASPLAPLIQL